MGVVVGVECADVTPICRVALRSRHKVGGEIVEMGVACFNHCRDEVATDVVPRLVVVGVFADDLFESGSVEDVVPHRCQD